MLPRQPTVQRCTHISPPIHDHIAESKNILYMIPSVYPYPHILPEIKTREFRDSFFYIQSYLLNEIIKINNIQVIDLNTNSTYKIIYKHEVRRYRIFAKN